MHWAIHPEALEQIFKVLNRDFDPELLTQSMHGKAELKKYLDENGLYNGFSAIEALPGEPLPGAKLSKMRDGVAIIPLIGPIFPRANLFTEWSGGKSISQLSLDFNAALRSDQIHTILFNVDSPGGEITGVSEFAQMIFEAGCGRGGKKKIIAYVSGMAASAAYWISSGADEIVIGTTAELGSIGVVAGFVDRAKQDEKYGVQRIEVVSSQSPKKRSRPTTDEGRAEIQRVVDDLADVFIGEVAKMRKTEVETVLSKFGRGGLIIGENAVKAGMADRISSLESTIQMAIDEATPSAESLFAGGGNKKKKQTLNNGGKNMNGKEQQVEITMSVEAVKDTAPDVYAQIRQEGYDAGVGAERKRIQGIESIKAPGFETLIAENKFKPEATKESVASMILDAQEAKREKAQKDLEADAQEAAEQSQGMDSGEHADADAEKAAAVGVMVEGANEKAK
jgi:ClpP class serine protease